MENKELIDTLRRLKQEGGYTLYESSKKIDIQISTLERWLKTNRSNRMHADCLSKKLKAI